MEMHAKRRDNRFDGTEMPTASARADQLTPLRTKGDPTCIECFYACSANRALVVLNPSSCVIPCFRRGPDGAPCASGTAPGSWDHAREWVYGSPTGYSIGIDLTRHADTTNMAQITTYTQTTRKPTVTCSGATARTCARFTHEAARLLTELAGAHPGHAETPPGPYRAHRPTLPLGAAPGRRGAPREEKLPRGHGGPFLRTRATAGM